MEVLADLGQRMLRGFALEVAQLVRAAATRAAAIARGVLDHIPAGDEGSVVG
jgi:hypothetical protein